MTGPRRRAGTLVLGAGCLLAAGCAESESQKDIDAPPFARELPGRTAIVAWSEIGRPLPLPLTAALFTLGRRLKLEPRLGRDHLAFLTPRRVRVGWPTLEDQPGFRELLRRRAEPAAARVHVDLQQIVASLPADLGLGDRAAFLRDRLVEVAGLRGLRRLELAVEEAAGRLVVRGRLWTSDQRRGLPALLTASPPVALGAPAPSGDSLQLELALEPAALRTFVRRATVSRADRNEVMAGLTDRPRRLLDLVCRHLTGRISIAARDAESLVAVLGVRDGRRLERRLRSELRGRLPRRIGPLRVRFEPDRLVLTKGGDARPRKLTPAGELLPGAVFWARVRWGSVRATCVALHESAAALRLRLVLGR